MTLPNRLLPYSLLALVSTSLAIFSAFAQDANSDPMATRDYAVALGLQQDKQLFAQAAKRWVAFIQDYPNDPRLANAHHHLGVCLMREKQFAEAAKTFGVVEEKYPKFAALDATLFNRGLALYNLGLTAKKADDLRAAARAFAAIPEKFAKSKHAPTALYYQGESLYQAGDVAEAIAAYQKAITSYPTSDLLGDVYYALGTAQQKLSRHEDAIGTFTEFVKKFPTAEQASECRLRLGQSLFQTKKYAEAGRVFEAVGKLPKFPYADFALMQQAQCLYEQNQFVPAAKLFETLPVQFPKSKYAGAALVAGGKCLFHAGQFAQAQTTLAAVLAQKHPEAPEAAYWLGQTLIKLDKPAEALAVADQAIAAHPKSDHLPQLTFLRINALYEQPARRKETVALYAAFARERPDHELSPRAVYMAALAALQVEDLPGARKYAEEYLGNKNFAKQELLPEVLFIAGESHLRASPPDYLKAQPHYQRVLTEFPKHPQTQQAALRVGMCLHLAKKYTESVALLTGTLDSSKDPLLIAEANLLLGRNHLEGGKAADAIAALQKALQVRPKWERGDTVLLLLAQACRSEKRLAETVAHLQQLNTGYPKSPYRSQALYELGSIAYDQNKYPDALVHYEQVLSAFPKSDLAPKALYGIGLVRLAQKDDARTAETFGKFLAENAGSDLAPRAAYLRGLAQQRLGKYAESIKDLTAFLAGKPPEKDALDARYALGLCQASLKQHEQAAATFAALLRVKPTYERADSAAYEMAFALLHAKKEQEAATAFRELAVKHPSSPLAAESCFRAGEYHEKVKALADAVECYTAGLRTVKATALREKLQYKLGWVYYQQKKYAEASEVLQAQIKEHGKGELAGDAVYLAGECLFQQEKFAEALALFEQAVKSNAKKYLARALYRCGACCGNLKQWPASQKHYQTLVDQFPEFEMVHEGRYGLAWALQNQDKLDEAQAIYEQVTKATNTETAAKSRFMIGECAFKQKKHKEAIEHFLAAALGYSYEEWQVLGNYEAGRCFLELMDKKRALDCFLIIAKKYPKHPRAKDAARFIADLMK